MKTYDVNREDIERYVSTGFELAINTLLKDGVITDDQAEEYYNYGCTSITNKSVMERMAHLFGKEIPENHLSFKFVALNLNRPSNER